MRWCIQPVQKDETFYLSLEQEQLKKAISKSQDDTTQSLKEQLLLLQISLKEKDKQIQ